MESDVSRISFSKLLLRSLLAGTIATLVLFPFHYLMRKVALLPSLPYFEGPIGKVFYLALIFLLAYADLFFVTLIRGRNESSEILGKFVRRGIPLRYLADLLVVFLCCLLSFSIGIALGAEAPSVFMSSLIFGMVFSRGKKDRNLSGEGIELYLQPCSWWLRTCGREDGDVAAVEEDGSVDLVGKDSGCDEVGLRPAIWLDLDRIARLPELLRPDQL